MADDSNFRTYRPVDEHWPAQSPASSREGHSDDTDPLAELARLIGQSEPFGDLKKDVPRPSPAQSRPTAAAMPPVRTPAPAAASQGDHYGSPLQFGSQQFGSYTEPQQERGPSYSPEAYYDDPPHTAEGGEAYQDDYGEERPRRGLKLVLLVSGLAIIGTSSVFGYRAIFSGGPSDPPPVIKANTTPSKIVPAPAAEASNKQIYDRVGEGSQGERIVSREEKPVEVKDNSRSLARVAVNGLPPSSGAQDTAMAPSPPLNTDPGGPASAEPRKIRTVVIRPDQTGGTGSTPAPRPTATPSGARAAATTPAPPVAAPAPEPAPTTASSPPRTQSNAPLSLNPQVASADASARPAFPPPPSPAASPAAAAPTRVAAVPPAAEATSGAYTVQISSQRSETEAQASFRSLQGKFPNLLGDRQPMIRRADLGEKGIYFRTMVGPFASADQAKEFCGSLKSAGGQCVVQRN